MRKKKLKKAKAAEMRAILEQYMRPGETDQTRPSSIEEVKARCANSPSPRFQELAAAFVAAYREGDVVEEYYSSKRSWNEGMGTQGYRLSRDGKQIDFLVTAMN